MPQVLTIPPVPWQTPRPKKLTFRHLPYEIRKRIYELALIEPLRWKKTHEPNCPHKPTNKTDIEIPPFLQTNVWLYPSPHRIATDTKCSCAKRKGLSLLQTCRQISLEASPMFWSGNTFCFLSGWEFVIAVGHQLRSEQRKIIRSISLLGDDGKSWQLPRVRYLWRCSSVYLGPFWDLLLECEALEHLEMPQDPLKRTPSDVLQKMASSGTKLRHLTLAQFIPYYGNLYRGRLFLPGLNYGRGGATYVKCSRRVSWEDFKSEESLTELLRDLEYNFRVHVDTAVKIQFLGAELSRLEFWRHTFKLAPDLNEHSSVRQVVLPTGEKTAVEFFGLPISGATRRKVVKHKIALDRRQRDINGLTAAQHEVVQRGKERKKMAREEVELQKQQEYETGLAERRLRRLELRDTHRAAAREQRKDVQSAAKEAAELRSKERKRVQHDAKKGGAS
ncbi:hypothetical protein QQS21_007238 [Conoideocrella luteorostrata]|uniref:DUF7730 domain-containing protein n=1 Tax=Conoideocrella luteorostrata TaxID=1105319 RepID=A0AAJ0FXK0_9HYPO|nr:hypothetical protein QQS21_007238 [Conoideocrella luteorostrata]